MFSILPLIKLSQWVSIGYIYLAFGFCFKHIMRSKPALLKHEELNYSKHQEETIKRWWSKESYLMRSAKIKSSGCS